MGTAFLPDLVLVLVLSFAFGFAFTFGVVFALGFALGFVLGLDLGLALALGFGEACLTIALRRAARAARVVRRDLGETDRPPANP